VVTTPRERAGVHVSPAFSRRALLVPYLVLVIGAGWGLLVVLAVGAPPWEALAAHPWEFTLLLVGLVVGEQRPIPVSRSQDAGDEITISTSFALAMVVLGPLSMVVLGLGAAVILLDVRWRRPLRKVFFNVGQYTITLVLARMLFCFSTGVPVLGGYARFDPDDLPSALAAGLLFFVVNHGLVAAVVALDMNQSFTAVLREDLDFVVVTSLVLVALGPLAAYIVQDSVPMLPLLFMPILAVHRSTSLAAERERQALHDSLTGLPNRELLRRRAEKAIVDRAPGELVAFVLLDLDHFKEINDTLGHHAGDELLVATGRRLLLAAPSGALVCRLGGDEFAVLMTGLDANDQALDTAAILLEALTVPYEVGGVRISVGGSAGVAVGPTHGEDPQTLLKCADIALYDAKKERGRCSLYRPEQDRHSPGRLSLLADLRRAVEADELVLHYQPVVDCASGRPVAVEALVRWAHPQLGLLGPEAFVSLAENTGLIAAVTDVVLEQALRHNAELRARGIDLTVALNISAREVTDLALIDRVSQALQRWLVPAYRVVLEVTETGIMSDPSRANTVLAGLRRLGLAVAVDDFGTGQTSLNYLKRLDVDELKIDRSFVTPMLSTRADETIVRSTIALAHDLGLTVVAEGVEDLQTWNRLQLLGCDYAQGYVFSRPLPFEELETCLALWRERDALRGQAVAATVQTRSL